MRSKTPSVVAQAAQAIGVIRRSRSLKFQGNSAGFSAAGSSSQAAAACGDRLATSGRQLGGWGVRHLQRVLVAVLVAAAPALSASAAAAEDIRGVIARRMSFPKTLGWSVT